MSPLEQRIAEMKAELIRVVAKAEEDMSRVENSFKAMAIENTQLREALSVAREALRHIAQDVGSHFGSTLESTDCLEADGFRQAVSTARAALTAIDAAMKEPK